MPQPHTFDQSVALSLDAQGQISGNVSDKYLVNGVPNGGYLMAMLTQAAFQYTKRQAPVSVTANFMNRSEPGSMTFNCDIMNQSKQFDRFQVSGHQNGKENIRAFISMMDDFPEGTALRYEKPEPEVLARDKCLSMVTFPGYSIFNNVDLVMEPQCFDWVKGRPATLSESRGWINMGDRPWDALSVLLASDAFPPPLLASHGMVAWIPTIEMSVQLRKIPTSKWLKCVFKTSYVTDSLVEEDGELWDEDGHLVAISRQLAQFKIGKVSTPIKLGLKAAGLYYGWKQRQVKG